MKKYFILGLLCLVGMNSYAQKLTLDLGGNEETEQRISPQYREKTEQYALKIRQVVIEEKVAMEKEISQVEEDLKSGIISKTQAENLKADISLHFAERINSGIERIDFDLDDAVKQQVQFTILNTDVEQLKKEVESQGRHTHGPKNEMVGYLSYGMISLEDGKNEKLNDHLGYSSGIDFGILYNRQFSKTSPFVFLTGAYLSWRTIRFDDNYFINRDENGVVDLLQYESNLDKSKLRSTYIMVPIGIKYSTARLVTTNGESYRNTDKGIGITANLYGGFRISTNNIVKSDDRVMNFRDKKSNYKLNDFAYGAQLTLSIYGWNFFVRQELSSFFKENVFDDRKMLQFGINFGF